jgi:hypothetical protein
MDVCRNINSKYVALVHDYKKKTINFNYKIIK